MKTKIFFFFVFLLILIPVVSSEDFGYNYLEGELNVVQAVNYTLVSVNDSTYWDGNAWSDTRWLNIDGSNANQDIDIGIYDFYANDGFFDYLNFSYLFSNFGGGIDATGDPWYLGGTDFQIAENLLVDGNVTIGSTNIFWNPAGIDHLDINENMKIGSGIDGEDTYLYFSGFDNSGSIAWWEDEDYFRITDDIFQTAGAEHYFRDDQIYITSDMDGYLDLHADERIDLNANVYLAGNNITNANYITADYFFGNWNGSSDYVPYTGATSNVDLGNYNLTIDDTFKLTNTTTTWNMYVDVNGTLVWEQE